jgi:hypothetical protein
MEKKPWPIIILATLHICEPIFKIVFYSWYWHRPLFYFLALSSLKSPYAIFMTFGAFPLAGLSILAVKRWSLPVFILIEVLTLIEHLRTVAQLSPLIVVGACALNIIVVSYFLIPAVRLMYIDPKLRWWEAQARYYVNWPATIEQEGRVLDAVIKGISRGGVFFQETVQELNTQGKLLVNFKYSKYAFSIRGAVAHSSCNEGRYQYGIKFEPLFPHVRKQVKAVLRELEKLGIDRRPRRESVLRSLINWLRGFVTTGQGLIPEYKQRSPQKKEPEVFRPVRKAS